MHKIKVLIVDDHPMVLEGMSAMLAQIEFVEIAGTAANAYEAMQQIKLAAPDIVSVYEGKLYMSLDINLSAADKQELNNVPILSSREKEVLVLIADGFTNPQIAGKLFISLHTVDSHRKNLLTKFAVNNTAGLIKLAAKYNMV